MEKIYNEYLWKQCKIDALVAYLLSFSAFGIEGVLRVRGRWLSPNSYCAALYNHNPSKFRADCSIPTGWSRHETGGMTRLDGESS